MENDKLEQNEGDFYYKHIYKEIIETLPHVVWVGDAEGKLMFINEAWETWTGMSREEALGFGWARAIHPDDSKALLEKWGNAYKNGASYEGECRFLHENGDILYCSFLAKPVFNSEGKITNWIGLDMDISLMKCVEEELKNKVNELERINDLMIDRELKMADLKVEIKILKAQLAIKVES